MQQKEQEARGRNFIIHGFQEQANAEMRDEDDHNTIQEFLSIIKVKASLE